jgi:hypothetical protein
MVAILAGLTARVDARRAEWQAREVIARTIASLSMALALGCEGAVVANCDTGIFVETADDHFCVYDSDDTLRCPPQLPIETALPWGGYMCSAHEHDRVPREVCIAAGECEPDGGTP